MSGTQIALREAAFVAIAARLSAQLAGVPVERNRRAPIDASETLPRLVVRDGGHRASPELAQGETQYEMDATVEGYAAAATAPELATALNTLHARVIAALVGSEIPVGTAGQSIWILEDSLELDLAPVSDAETPAGAFYCALRFDVTWPHAAGPYTT